MGVVYRLTPEVRNFVLAEKKNKPGLSCRSLIALIEANFHFKVSKSSINTVIKEAGLSMPVGRRTKRRILKIESPSAPVTPITPIIPELPGQPAEPVIIPIDVPSMVTPPVVPPEQDLTPIKPLIEQGNGVILLKAMDYILGGSFQFAEAINKRLHKEHLQAQALTENCIYASLQGLSQEAQSYLDEIQLIREICPDISHITANLFQEVRCIKVILSDGRIFYFDGKLHAIWSTPYIPYDFSVTHYAIKSYIDKAFSDKSPLVLHSLPDVNYITEEFFNFLMALETQGKRIDTFIYYNNNLVEKEAIQPRSFRKQFFVTGLWPWQVVDYIKIKLTGEFQPHYFYQVKKEFLVSELEAELIQPNVAQAVRLRGCVLRNSLNEKNRLYILTNLEEGTYKPEHLVNIYLNQWPNLEEGFEDFRQKIESFSYLGSSQQSFSTNKLQFTQKTQSSLKALFDYYLEALDLYLKWYFLPPSHRKNDFSTTKSIFYDLATVLNYKDGHLVIQFQPPENYLYKEDLTYACRRLNERNIASPDGRRMIFSC